MRGFGHVFAAAATVTLFSSAYGDDIGSDDQMDSNSAYILAPKHKPVEGDTMGQLMSIVMIFAVVGVCYLIISIQQYFKDKVRFTDHDTARD